jgi:MoaA/NifB/PqqE/SkfB family radical SAM enzyme
MREQAKKFPMMIVVALVYPCNFGCPFCPYSQSNSDLRKNYSKYGGDYLPLELWQKVVLEAGLFGSWMRCTGGGEPMMHPEICEMLELAKASGCKVWLNTNGSLFGPQKSRRQKLQRLIDAKVDLIEFSMDAADAETYNKVRPPLMGEVQNIEKRWLGQVNNIEYALEYRKKVKSPTRIVVSIIRQKTIQEKLDEAIVFWNEIGVDEVITRKFLSWDQNTTISLENSSDSSLYQIEHLNSERVEPCVWPFERLNIDTLGRVALCGQDISFSTSSQFPNIRDASIEEIWNGETFNRYRELHLLGRGSTVSPCNNCSAWKAGIRDWQHGWIKVLEKSGKEVQEMFKHDLGVQVEVHTPKY